MRARRDGGFTLLELILTIAILSIFTAAAIPIARNAVQRQREVELRRALRELRTAIDRYKRAYDAGIISRFEAQAETEGYPPNLDVLVNGCLLYTSPSPRDS